MRRALQRSVVEISVYKARERPRDEESKRRGNDYVFVRDWRPGGDSSRVRQEEWKKKSSQREKGKKKKKKGERAWLRWGCATDIKICKSAFCCRSLSISWKYIIDTPRTSFLFFFFFVFFFYYYYLLLFHKKREREESSLARQFFCVGSVWWDYGVHQIISGTGRVKRWMEKSSSSSSHSSKRLSVRRYLQVDDYRWWSVSRSIRHPAPLGSRGSLSFAAGPFFSYSAQTFPQRHIYYKCISICKNEPNS